MDAFDRMARRVAAGATEFHLVVTDEPQGVAVGFRPSDEALDRVNGVLDSQWVLVADDGSDDADPVLVGPGNEVELRSGGAHALTQEELDAGIVPLGMDLLVWRDEESMLEDLTLGG